MRAPRPTHPEAIRNAPNDDRYDDSGIEYPTDEQVREEAAEAQREIWAELDAMYEARKREAELDDAE